MRNKNAIKSYEGVDEKRINQEKKKHNGIRRADVDKNLRSNRFLAFGSEGKRVFAKKKTLVKVLAILFTEFWNLLNTAFKKTSKTTFKRFKLLNLKPKDREIRTILGLSLKDLASTCNVRETDEAE